MLLADLDDLLKTTFSLDEYAGIDNSRNGVQVERENQEIRTMCCAVDACFESIRRAKEMGADMLFVHHGLFWGRDLPLTGSHFKRISHLIKNDLALYAVHLPLDLHEDLGNNSGIAEKLGLAHRTPFGEYKGKKIGFKGVLSEPMTLDGIVDTLEFDREVCNAILDFGPDTISSVGIVSGGATHEISQAVDERLDLYITGESSHELYHFCLEENIHLLAGGHYQTETFGVKSLAEMLNSETDVDAQFIDIPTGL